jgi:hypothetical protein
MNLILRIPPDTEAQLKEQAELVGKSPEDLALEALQEKLASSADSAEMLPPDTRLAEFRDWMASHPVSLARDLDDSRDSIYEGCGE